jgi:hypothetical protein
MVKVKLAGAIIFQRIVRLIALRLIRAPAGRRVSCYFIHQVSCLGISLLLGYR